MALGQEPILSFECSETGWRCAKDVIGLVAVGGVITCTNEVSFVCLAKSGKRDLWQSPILLRLACTWHGWDGALVVGCIAGSEK